jgi:hypothetical protein
MWTTIALLTALAATPAQSDLSLTHVRSTRGLLGPERKADEIAPGDEYFLCFDIEGITVEDAGKVRYSLEIEARDSRGKIVFRQEPKANEATVSLGGTSVPAYARLSIGLDTPEGDYQLKVTIKDSATGKQQSLTRSLKILPRNFALVRGTISVDTEAEYPAAVLLCGQGVWVHCNAVEFTRKGPTEQPDIDFEIRILDNDGKSISSKPIVQKVNKDVPSNRKNVPLGFPLSLNRAGKFTVEVTASDQLSGKKAKLSMPLTVLSAPKE